MVLAAKNAKSAKKAWPMVRLGDVCEFRRGLTYKKSDEVEYSSNIVLRSNNVSLESGALDFSELKYIRESIEIPSEKRVVKDSILMCMANGSKSHLGKVALIEEDFGYAFGGFMGLLVPQGIEPGYLHFALKSGHFKRLIEQLQDGANINNLKFADIEDYSFPLPPLSVQREIVARLEKELGEADALAAKFKEIAENADAEFKAELDETFKELEGDVSPRCERVKLGEVLKTPPRNGYSPKPVPYETKTKRLTLTATTSGYFKPQEYRYIAEEIPKDSYLWLIPGDLLVQRSNSLDYIGTSCIFTGEPGEYIYPDLMMKLVPLDCLNVRFADYALKTTSAHLYFQQHASGAAGSMPKINKETVMNLELFLPPLKSQHTIVARLDKAKEKCEKLKAAAERGLRAAEDLRKAILAEAFEQ